MAKEEEIIIIDDNEATDAKETAQDEITPEEDEEAKKKKIIIFGGIAIVLVLIIVIVLLLVLKSSQSKKDVSMDFIDTKLQEKNIIKIETSRLEKMIAKANYMYSSGSKKEALVLYEKIAQYSEAISLYNLGVAQLKNKQYKIAQKTFQEAIKNDEKRCVSAINAAVCSLHLNDKESFRYHIDLAYAYLSREINSPLYSYYYALINYYNNNYLEALSALQNSNSQEYPYVQKDLKSKLSALFGNDYDAIESMEKNFETTDDFSIGLLYARVGDFPLAKTHLEEAILKNIQPVKAQLALGLINLKEGSVASGLREIKGATNLYPEKVYTFYPINVKLKESLFDAKKAQMVYRNKVENNKLINFQKIFYFSPYKIYNANQTISYIRKGTASIYIDNVESAKEYLKKSASSSGVNYGITKAIKKALSFQIRDANKALLKLIKVQPKHSVLQYDLGLTFAQIGNMSKAHEHFLLSYHLDAKNYLSGVYAVMTSQLINKENAKLRSILMESISEEDDSEEKDMFLALLNIASNNFLSSVDWLDHNYKQRPLYKAMSIIIAIKLNKMRVAQEEAKELVSLLPHDILPHMMYIDAYFYDLRVVEYSSKVLNYIKNQKFNYKDLYYGPYITRYLFIQQNLISGKLFFLAEHLQNVIETTNSETKDIVSALAMVYLFDKKYEKAYALYNLLIDEVKMRDAHTLFLGAVASIAANHHANAIALLKLSSMKDISFAESRYTLGLLYMEIRNNEAAIIQLEHIEEESFISEYVDFNIEVDKLLFKKQHPNS